jgi:hypothetical protein
MSKAKEIHDVADLVPMLPGGEVTVLPPNSGVVGKFIAETENMFKARAMRMSGLLRRIDESGRRTEVLLRMSAEKMEAAAAALEQQFRKQGLVMESEDNADAGIY